MTLSEAIEHSREKAKELRAEAEYLQKPNLIFGADKKADSCLECAKEHEQLAEWLTELKEVRELVNRYYNSPITKFVFIKELLKIVKENDNE